MIKAQRGSLAEIHAAKIVVTKSGKVLKSYRDFQPGDILVIDDESSMHGGGSNAEVNEPSWVADMQQKTNSVERLKSRLGPVVVSYGPHTKITIRDDMAVLALLDIIEALEVRVDALESVGGRDSSIDISTLP